MAKPIPEGTEQERYFGAILEDIRDKFQIIVEGTKNSDQRLEESIKLFPNWENNVQQFLHSLS